MGGTLALASCPPFSSFAGYSSRMLRSDDQNRIIVQTIRRLDKHRTAKAVREQPRSGNSERGEGKEGHGRRRQRHDPNRVSSTEKEAVYKSCVRYCIRKCHTHVLHRPNHLWTSSTHFSSLGHMVNGTTARRFPLAGGECPSSTFAPLFTQYNYVLWGHSRP